MFLCVWIHIYIHIHIIFMSAPHAQAAWKYIKEEQPSNRKLELVTINPGFVLGPALTKAPGSSTGSLSRFLCHTHSRSCARALSFSLARSISRSLSRFLSLSLSHLLSLFLSRSLSRARSLSLTHTRYPL